MYYTMILKFLFIYAGQNMFNFKNLHHQGGFRNVKRDYRHKIKDKFPNDTLKE